MLDDKSSVLAQRDLMIAYPNRRRYREFFMSSYVLYYGAAVTHWAKDSSLPRIHDHTQTHHSW